MSENVIDVKNVNKQYAGRDFKANNNISLNLKKGEILCIAGENGAGKTTLMKIICSLEKQDSGDVSVNGKIGMVHQHFMLFPEYTAAENIVMGKEPLKFNLFFDKKKADEEAGKIIKANNFSIKSTSKLKELTSGQMQQVEICRILYNDADILIFDEPTSILTENEINSLFNTLKNLVSKGKSIIFITHKLNEIKQIADRAAVLKNGELISILDSKNSEIDIEKIAAMMIGDKDSNKSNDLMFNRTFEQSEIKKKEKTVISFNDVTVIRKGEERPLLENINFSVSSGEIIGFTGVGGNGLGVIEAVLGGFLKPHSGKIYHYNNDISDYSIQKLRKQGLSYVPADRIRVGSAGNATIEENKIINIRHNYFKTVKKNKNKDKLLDKNASVLSGGNLQKLILEREMNQYKDYIVLSEPTWGLDITSSYYIMEEIEKLRKNGAAIILISTDLEVVLKLADKIYVMHRGKIKKEFINDGNFYNLDKEIRNIKYENY
ncbi:MAG: ATP-binding cassette domain-containing protein [Treponema sp.]|nr:ATP-binding cassette domain-containing protein [Treponema sp.]